MAKRKPTCPACGSKISLKRKEAAAKRAKSVLEQRLARLESDVQAISLELIARAKQYQSLCERLGTAGAMLAEFKPGGHHSFSEEVHPRPQGGP